MQSQTLYVRLTVAAPLHVGCAEVYEPTSFVIDEKTKELVHFETRLFLDKLDRADVQTFSSICRKGTPASLIELMKFIRFQAKNIQMDGERISVADALVSHYDQTLKLPLQDRKKVNQELNQFQILRTAYDLLTGDVYLPGSAVKGAIRTAVLNLRHSQHTLPRKNYEKMKPVDLRKEEKTLQRGLLGGDFDTDPLRLVKVSDFFPVGKSRRHILYAVDRKKKPSKFESRAPYQIVEVVESDTKFIGTITLSKPLRQDVVKNPVDMAEIVRALKEFYGMEKIREDRVLKGIGVSSPSMEVNNNQFPLRVGRHCGAECVTVNGHRNIRIVQGGGKPAKSLDHTTTVWLAAESRKPTDTSALRPFGWLIFENLDSDTWTGLRRWLRLERDKWWQKQQESVAEREAERTAYRIRREEEEHKLKEQRRAAADPTVQRQKKCDEFILSLPNAVELPGHAAGILEQIKEFEDPELRRACLRELRTRFKEMIQKGKKKNKNWAQAIQAMCEDEGV